MSPSPKWIPALDGHFQKSPFFSQCEINISAHGPRASKLQLVGTNNRYLQPKLLDLDFYLWWWAHISSLLNVTLVH